MKLLSSIVKDGSRFEFMDNIQKCDHSNESY